MKLYPSDDASTYEQIHCLLQEWGLLLNPGCWFGVEDDLPAPEREALKVRMEMVWDRIVSDAS